MNTYDIAGLAQALFQEAGDALFLFEPDTDHLLDVNPMAERLSGFPRARLLAMPATYWFRFAGSQRGSVHRLRQAARKSDIFHSQEGFFLRTHRDRVWVPVNLTIARLHVQPKTLALITARDIREQRAAHARLVKTEAELRRVLDSVSDCLWSAEIDDKHQWVYRYISPVVKKITGRPPDFFLASVQRWQSLVHPEDRARWEKAHTLVRTGEPTQEEYRIVGPDGTLRWVRDSIMVSRDAQGRSLRLDGVLTDITAHKRAEQALVHERCLVLTLMDNVPDSIYFKDTESRFTRVNRATARRFGLRDPAEAVGKTDFDFFTSEHARQAFADEQQVMRSRQPLEREEKETWPDGRETWVSTIKIPLIEPDGKLIGTFGLSRDITKRKREEEARRRAQHELERQAATLREQARLLDLAHDAIMVFDLGGTILFWNQGAEEMYGWARAEVVGHSHRHFLQTQFPRPLAEIEADLLQEGRWEGELVHTRRNGVRVVVASRWALQRDDQGRPAAVLEINTDITERKQTEEALRQAKEAAEAASRAKSEFLATMSHEIRTPMNGILGMTELALNTQLTAEQHDYLSLVKSSAESLLTVINDVLDFSKIEAGKLELARAPFRLRDTLGDILRTLALRAHQKGLELACRIRHDVPDALAGDTARFHQVVVNLVGNAIKFTDRGQVVVQVAAEPGAAEEACLHFTVSDTGIGVPREKQQAIFDAFEQVDSSLARKYEGTGLGLAISSKLIALMGGRIWVDSEVGRGSTFHFTARFGLAKELPSRPAPAELTGLRGLAVLVVDDNAASARILEEILAGWGLAPTVADGGEAALAELRRAADAGEPYPLILLDGQMPQTDGFTLAARLRESPGLAGAVVMMLSSSDLVGDTARCRELGIAAHLAKPVKPSDLLEAILAAARLPAQRNEALAPAGWSRTLSVGRRLRMLLVEDNAINQKLMVHLLESEGHKAVVASNGREALIALGIEPRQGEGASGANGERRQEHGTAEQNLLAPASAPFDLILMDVQMPEMDGFEATGRIRDHEQQTGGHLPIIAMTAYAMKGDRERCLEAGMDGYVTKPIQAGELWQTIRGVLPPQVRAALVPLAPEQMDEVLDRREALADVGGNVRLLREIAELFLDDCPRLMGEIRDAIARRDAFRLRRAAHTLKGSVSSFGAPKALAAVWRLERMGSAHDLTGAEEAQHTLEHEIGRLEQALLGLAQGTPNAP
jgi:PAS domain S-box-containing protein